jgi:hypothetical protein
MKIVIRGFLLLLSVYFSITSVYALPVSTASQVALKKDCGADPNCFSDATSLLNWVWVTRKPSATSPLIVDIGAGVFGLPKQAFCDSAGYVTFRGAGRDNSVLSGGGNTTLPGDAGTGSTLPVMFINNCANLTFQDLTILSGSRGGVSGSNVGIQWQGGGNSTWTNVGVKTSNYAWYDTCGSGSGLGTHYWFSSKFESSGADYNITYSSSCGSSWIYGGEILALADGKGGTSALLAVRADTGGEVEIYGSAVRSIATVNNTGVLWNDFVGHSGFAANGGKIHMHGGVISVRSENPAINRSVNGVRSMGATGFVHTPDTAFGLLASGTGTANRVREESGGTAMSPFTWPAGVNPPMSAGKSINSANGQDMFVETDCSSTTGCRDTSQGTETHLLIYNNSCTTAGPWFDIVSRKCRGL